MSSAAELTAFAPRGRSSAALLFQRRPSQNPRYCAFAGDGRTPSVFVSQRALDQLDAAALDAFPNETIGVLLGRPCRDEEGAYAIVEASLTANPEEHKGTSGTVRISVRGRSLLHRRAAMLYPVLEPIGWWHSHPHGPSWYSRVDLDEQATYPKPYHVGIVVAVRHRKSRDGRRGVDDRFGIYAGPDGVRLSSASLDVLPTEGRHDLPPAPVPPPSAPEDDERRQAVPTALAVVAVVLAVIAILWVGLSSGGSGSSTQRKGSGFAPSTPRGPSLQAPSWLEEGGK